MSALSSAALALDRELHDSGWTAVDTSCRRIRNLIKAGSPLKNYLYKIATLGHIWFFCVTAIRVLNLKNKR